MISDGINTLVGVGFNQDVIDAEINCYQAWKDQPRELVSNLCDGSIDEKCEAVFAYLVNNVEYKLDETGNQFIKSPARLLADKCGDCKSFTMFIACCLHCLGIKHIIRFVNYDGGKQFTHVYPVAIDENGNEIVLDACEKDIDGVVLYNYARDYKRKKDFVYE